MFLLTFFVEHAGAEFVLGERAFVLRLALVLGLAGVPAIPG